MATARLRLRSRCSPRSKAWSRSRRHCRPTVLPAAAVILLALFAVQPFGAAAIGRAFGPIMLAWFVIIALLGIYGVAQHPRVFVAINPIYGLDYLLGGGFQGFLVLGGVFLCVTGAEALYADMGHFGPKPIRFSWSFVVFPALILNYAGQAAIVLAGAPTDGNIFYRLCPGPLLTPLIVTCDRRDRHREPVDHHRRLFDDAAGDPARLAAAHGDQADFRGRLRPDLCRRGQLASDDRDARPHDRLRQVRQSRRRLRHRRFGDDADHERAPIHRDARNLELARLGGGRGRGRVHHRRRQLFRRQYGQGVSGRLGPAAAGLDRLWRDVDLAPWRDGGADAGRLGADAAFRSGRATGVRQDRARAGLGGLLQPRHGSDAAGHVLACAPQPLASRTCAGADHDGRLRAQGR